MAIEEDVVRALEETAANLKQQSDLLRAQAADLRKRGGAAPCPQHESTRCPQTRDSNAHTQEIEEVR
jgi:hypothetical protein